jgi:hypothetical protein
MYSKEEKQRICSRQKSHYYICVHIYINIFAQASTISQRHISPLNWLAGLFLTAYLGFQEYTRIVTK